MSKNKGHTIGIKTNKTEAEEIKLRCDNLKVTKGYSKKDVFLAGLLALENGESESNLLYRKNKEIHERDKLLKDVIGLNRHIRGLNSKLRANYNRHKKNLDPDDNVLTIKVYDSKNNELEF